MVELPCNLFIFYLKETDKGIVKLYKEKMLATCRPIEIREREMTIDYSGLRGVWDAPLLAKFKSQACWRCTERKVQAQRSVAVAGELRHRACFAATLS